MKYAHFCDRSFCIVTIALPANIRKQIIYDERSMGISTWAERRTERVIN